MFDKKIDEPEVLEELRYELRHEDSLRIRQALAIFIKAPVKIKTAILKDTEFGGWISGGNIRDHFDFLEILEELDDCIKSMKRRVKSEESSKAA